MAYSSNYRRGRAPAPAAPRFPVELREADVRRLCTLAAFRWGDKLQRMGHVTNPILADNELSAAVRGIWRRVDEVTVRAATGRVQATCTCELPFCRHAAALLLAWIREPASFLSPRGSLPDEDDYDDDLDDLDDFDDDLDELDERRRTRPAASAQPAPTGDGAADEDLLQRLDAMLMNDLRALGRRRGVTAPARNKAELVRLLGRELSDPANVDAALAQLTPDERLTLLAADLLTATGGGSIPELGNAYGAVGGKERYQASKGPPGLDTLRELGLVMAGSRGPYEQVTVVPRPVMLRQGSYPALLRPADARRVAEIAGAGAPPRLSLLEVFLLIQRELQLGSVGANRPVFMVDQRYEAPTGWLVDRSGQEPDAQGRPPKTVRLIPQPSYLVKEDMLRLAELTGQPVEMVDFALWMMLATGCIEYAGDLQAVDGGWRLPHLRPRPARLDALLALPAEERVARLAAVWLYLPDSSDLRLVAALYPDLPAPLEIHHDTTDYWNQPRAPSSEMLRHVIARVVARLPKEAPGEGGWSSFAGLIDLLHAATPAVLRAPAGYRNQPVWWFTERRRPNAPLNLQERPDWLRAAGILAGAILSGPMAWLGLVDVVSTEIQVVAFRARPEAEVLAGRMPALSPPRPATGLRAEMDTESGCPTLLIPAGSPDSWVYNGLATFAALAGASAAGLQYRVTPESAQQAFDLGLTGPEMVRILEEQSRAPLPAAVRVTLDRWWDAFGSVRLYDDLTLIELSEDVLLEEALATAPLRRSIIHEFSPRLLAVDPAGVEEVVAALQRAGHLPRVVEEP